MIYTPELIKSVAPSVFATSASNKLSDKYVFVPTDQVIEYFDREGWEISDVSQTGRGIHATHQLKFRHGQLPAVGDTLVEAIVRNSHNGMSTFSVSAGLHRLVCSNGLVVPTSVAEKFNVRHSGFELDDVKRLMDGFSKKLPIIQGSVGRMMERELTIDEQIQYVQKASKIRWVEGSIPSDSQLVDILTPNRVEDNKNDLWTTFNVVQEKFVRGGFDYRTKTGRKSKLRNLKSILTVNNINTKLWELAEEMI
jgi:hypothetical protein